MSESQKPLIDGEARGCILPEMSKNRIKKALMLSNERWREKWEITIKKKKASLWKVLEAVGKDKNRGNWHKLLT